MQSGSENLTSTPAGELAAAGDLLALARSTDSKLTAPAPGSPEALELERTQQQQEASAPKLSLEQEIAGMFALIGTGAGQWLPRVGAVLTEPDKTGKSGADRLGEVLAPVAHKYGMARYFEGFAWRVELQALMVAGPIVLAIRDAARADLAELARKQREAEGLPPVAPIPQEELDRREVAEMDEIHKGLQTAPIGMLQPIERPRPAA